MSDTDWIQALVRAVAEFEDEHTARAEALAAFLERHPEAPVSGAAWLSAWRAGREYEAVLWREERARLVDEINECKHYETEAQADLVDALARIRDLTGTEAESSQAGLFGQPDSAPGEPNAALPEADEPF